MQSCAMIVPDYLVKRPGIVETALPYFIHRPLRSRFVRTCRVGTDRQNGTTPHTLLVRKKTAVNIQAQGWWTFFGETCLVLLRERDEPPPYLPTPPAVPAEAVRTNLHIDNNQPTLTLPSLARQPRMEPGMTPRRKGKATYLATSMMPEIVPVHHELCVVVHMHKLVYNGVLHMALVHELPLTEHYCARFWTESAGAGEVTRSAYDVGGGYVGTG